MLIKTRRSKHSHKGTYTHRNLLKDLTEIKSVLEIETKLKEALIKLAVARQAVGLRLSF